VELLVVMTIIAMLIAMTLPAVQFGREAARRASCMNNLKQLGLAAQSHESAQGFFPAGGWGWSWPGDPDRGFTKKQPGGWIYNILPYIDQVALHNLGKGLADTQKQATILAMVRTPLSLMYCPSRRKCTVYPMTWSGETNTVGYCGNSGPITVDPTKNFVARSDYAVNSGVKTKMSGSAVQRPCNKATPGPIIRPATPRAPGGTTPV
jgi:type II secretory pathway pseudopilin PulG